MEPLAEAGSTAAGPRVTVREIDAADAEACARICFEAFGALHDHHRFPRDFATLDMATDMIEALISDPSIWGVAAEIDGRVVGSNSCTRETRSRGWARSRSIPNTGTAWGAG
jgi:hypothetical protein